MPLHRPAPMCKVRSTRSISDTSVSHLRRKTTLWRSTPSLSRTGLDSQMFWSGGGCGGKNYQRLFPHLVETKRRENKMLPLDLDTSSRRNQRTEGTLSSATFVQVPSSSGISSSSQFFCIRGTRAHFYKKSNFDLFFQSSQRERLRHRCIEAGQSSRHA